MSRCERRFLSDVERCVPECDSRYRRPCPPPCPPRCCPYPYPYPYPPQPPYPPYPPTPPTPPVETEFQSSYVEAMMDTQTVATDADFAFDVTEENLDVAGVDIRVSDDGTTFTLTRAGLYHVEWSLNVGAGSVPMLIGLLENGSPTSAVNVLEAGNVSSGALINVKEEDLPYQISLHNFANPVTITSSSVAGNTAGSIRILRFADNESGLNP